MFYPLLEKFVSLFGYVLKPEPTGVENACRELGTTYYKDVVECPGCKRNFDSSKTRVY